VTGSLSPIRSSAPQLLASAELVIETPGEGFNEITREAVRFIEQSGAGEGVLLLYLRHTSASLIIQENADPGVQTDLVTALRRLAPADGPWVHTAEGPDDMPGHIKAMLAGVRCMCRSTVARSCSAPGRASIWSSTGHVRTAAR